MSFRQVMQVVIILLSLIACGQKEIKTKFAFLPEHPMPGEKITVYYNSDSTNLSGSKEMNMVLHSFNSELVETKSVKMKKDGNLWKSTFVPSDSCYGLVIRFLSDKLTDVNNKKGYKILLFDESENVLSEASFGLANAYSSWGRSVGLEKNNSLALSIFKEELNNKEELKSEFLSSYFSLLWNTEKNYAEDEIVNELEKLSKKTDLTEKEYSILVEWYGKLDQSEKSSTYESMLKEKFPKGDFVHEQYFTKFSVAADEKNKLDILDEYVKTFNNGKKLEVFYNVLATYYSENKEWKKATDLLKTNGDIIHVHYFQSIAGKMLNEGKDPMILKDITKIGVKKARIKFNNTTDEKPEYATNAEWKERKGYYLGMNLYRNGEVLYKLKKFDEAASNFEEAVKYTIDFYPQQKLNELYLNTLSKLEQSEKLLKESANLIETGNGSDIIKDYLHKSYSAINGNSDGYEKFLASLEGTAKIEMIADLKKKMIERPAPDFSLVDLDGKTVSLHDFKGKTVVLDFWATWCGPCRKSFPGMQKAVNKFKDNLNVKFLFINTRERVKDKTKNASDFIEKNNYSFHILMDEENKVVEKFQVIGIPTKFVIDQNGKIRFESIGFSGKGDELVAELEQMISMIN